MSEMIKRVTQAMLHEARHEGADSSQDYGDAEQLARAALVALREPTEDMIEAANGTFRDDDRKALIGEWQAMIDAALALRAPE